MNLNDGFTAVVTETGARVWNARYERLPIAQHLKPAPVAAGDTIRFQLWAAMQIFGPVIYMGAPESPFHMNEITPVVQANASISTS